MSQEVTESVPRWIFMVVLGILQALLCWIGISNYNKTSSTADTVIAIAVKLDGQDRAVLKLENRIDGVESRVNEQGSRLAVMERRK